MESGLLTDLVLILVIAALLVKSFLDSRSSERVIRDLLDRLMAGDFKDYKKTTTLSEALKQISASKGGGVLGSKIIGTLGQEPDLGQTPVEVEEDDIPPAGIAVEHVYEGPKAQE